MSPSLCCICDCPQYTVLFRLNDYDFCRCDDCGLAYIQPQPTAHNSIYNLDYYHKRSILSVSKFSQSMHVQHLKTLESSVLLSQRRLLDIGCGTGSFLDIAQSRGWTVEGFDTSMDAIQYAREHYALNIHDCDISQLPRRTYDVITLWDVLEHLHNPFEHLSYIYNLLKPGGILAISTPNIAGISTSIAGKHSSIFNTADHLYYFSIHTLRQLLAKAGFNVIRCITETIYVRNITLLLSRALKKDSQENPFYQPLYNSMQNSFMLRGIILVNSILRIFGLGDQITVFARKE